MFTAVGTGAGGGAALWRLCEQLQKTEKRIGVVERGSLLLPTNAFNIPTGTTAGSLYNNPQIGIRLGDALPQFPGIRLVYALGGRTLFWGAVCPRIPDFELASWPVPIPEMHRYYSIAERMMNVTDLYSRYSTFTQNLLDRLRANGYPEAVDQPVGINLQPTQYGELVITPERKLYELRSKTVVLAASALETPRILLNSGIPGRAIGHYLTNHSIVRGIGQISSTDLPEILGMINILVPQTWYRPIQLQIFGAYYSYQFQTKPRVNNWDDNVLITLGKVQSLYENRIFLDPLRRDAYGLPEIQVQISYSPEDWAIIEESAAALRNVASQIGLKLDLSAEGSDVCLFLPGADNHESGTCRMGRDPRTSVTNPIGSVHRITGLYITDNSVLPSMGAVNPTLSTEALAIRTADYIASECR